MGDATGVATPIRDGRVIWEVPGKAVSVYLTPDVVSRLGMAVREGFKALPRRGLETGGLLIGVRKKVNGHVIVEIDDFEAVESEHAAGPSYLLSDADRNLLEERIAAHSSSDKTVVGFYRSHTRSGFSLTVEDDYLYSNYFRKASDVFLLIKSNDGGPPTGGFIIRENGRIVSHTPYAQFPFHQLFAMTPPPPAPAPVREVPVSALPLPLPPPEMEVQYSKPPMRRVPSALPARPDWVSRRSTWLAAAGAAAVLAVLVLGFRSGASGPPEQAPPLALSVVNTGNGLRLSWDHRVSSRAHGAMLWIRDGKDEQRVELDTRQLNEGSVMYWPRSSDVNFRLQLIALGPTVSESVRAIGGPAPPPAVVPVPPTQAAAALPPSVPPPSATPQIQIATTSHKRPLREFEPPAAIAQQEAAVPDAPTIDPLAALHLTRSAEFLRPIAPPTTSAFHEDADSSVRVRVEPVSSSRLSNFAKRLPVVGRRYRHDDYTPPSPLREPPAPVQRNVAHDVNIDVKVYVNSSGKVDYSEVLSKVGASNRDLAAAAVFSARKCEFIPARAGDDTVPGEVILHYQFGPGALASADPAAR